jgi:hypothetical protein
MFYLLLIERKKVRNGTGLLRAYMPFGCAVLGFFWLLGAIKSYFVGQSLNFMYTKCVRGYYFG